MTTNTDHDPRREHDAVWSQQRDAGAACAHATIGGRHLVRRLSDSRFGARYLARDPRRDTDCILWLFDRVPGDRGPSVWGYLKRTAGIRRPHVLTVDAAGRDTTGTWAATPYIGNHDGIVSLESLRAARGGVMSPFEVRRVIDQLLDASAAAHKAGEHHGELDPTCILVNPRGTLEIGMYGLLSSIEGDRAGDDLIADEVRSIGLIAQPLAAGRRGRRGPSDHRSCTHKHPVESVDPPGVRPDRRVRHRS